MRMDRHNKEKSKQKENLSPDEIIKKKKKRLKVLQQEIIIKIILLVGVCFVAFNFIFGITVVETDDMYPAVREGDVAIFFRLGKENLMNSDVVIYSAGTKQRIGRIEGCSGIALNKTKSGELTIDGNLQPIQKRAGLYYKTKVDKYGKLKLPSSIQNGQYLILGDKREEATDSRELGLINASDIKGKVFTILRRRAL